VAYFDGAVWLGATDDGTYPYFGDNQLLRLDPADGSIDQRIAVATGAVAGVVDGTLWVVSGNAPETLDPATGTLGRGGLEPDGSIPSTWSLAKAAGRLFGRNSWSLFELDPETGAMLGEATLPLDSSGNEPEVFPVPIAGEGDVLYLATTDRSSPVIAAYDVAAGAYRWVEPVERGAVGLAIADGLLWVLVGRPYQRQLLFAFDLATGEQKVDAALPQGTSLIEDGHLSLRAAADGTLWVLSAADGIVFRIDTAAGQAVEQFHFSRRPTEFVVTDDAVVGISQYEDRVMVVPRDAFVAVPVAS
ncbi:MAG: PQQ-binding-like beta-propeller repeat protein, partial [Ilumatobacteraceae bacterium]